MEALRFGCYGVIIWFLSGTNESKWFLLFSLSDIFLRYSCAQFSVYVLRKFIIITSLRSYALITRYAFHAHCCVIYQRTITQEADVFWEDQHFIKFPSKIVRFCHFLWKVIRQPHFLFRYVEVFKIDSNICENQKNEWSVCCLLEHINIDLSNFPYYFVW